MFKLRSREEEADKLHPSPNASGSMSATAIPMSSTIIMLAEFQQCVKRDFTNVLQDSRALRLERPQPGTLQLVAGTSAGIADNKTVNLVAAARLQRLAHTV